MTAAITTALLNPFSEDPLRPYMVALAWTIWAKLALEFALRLPMRWLYVSLWSSERSARSRVIIAMGVVLAIVTSLAFGQ